MDHLGQSGCHKGPIDGTQITMLWGRIWSTFSVQKGAFDGGRKCIPRFCGGMEDIILKRAGDFVRRQIKNFLNLSFFSHWSLANGIPLFHVKKMKNSIFNSYRIITRNCPTVRDINMKIFNRIFVNFVINLNDYLWKTFVAKIYFVKGIIWFLSYAGIWETVSSDINSPQYRLGQGSAR